MFRKWQRHSIASLQHLSARPDCTNTDAVPSLTLRTALSAIELASDRSGVAVS